MSRPSPYILARAKRAAELLREAAQIMGQLEKMGDNRRHGRDILHAQSIAADLDLHYRTAHEKKSLNPLPNVLG
jgi:hypothetical protein